MISSIEEAWRRVAEAMTYLESCGMIDIETRRIRGVDTDCHFNNREQLWELDHHMGLHDGN